MSPCHPVTRPANFNCIIPLSFIPDQSELGYLPGPTGLTDLKTLAIARLMVPNIAHIKAFWIMQTVGLSQLSLSYGCDDLDGTVVWYDITKREGHGVHQELHVSDIKRIIREAGRTPVERDTLYNEVRRNDQDGVMRWMSRLSDKLNTSASNSLPLNRMIESPTAASSNHPHPPSAASAISLSEPSATGS